MSNTNPKKKQVKQLDFKLDLKRRLFLRYYHSYKRAYHNLSWEIEESILLIRNHNYTSYNVWQLNEMLYKYAESSISALNWMSEEKKLDFPFVHQFLREWRNENHHDARIDFSPSELNFNVQDKSCELKDDFYIMSLIGHNYRFKKLLNKWFNSEYIATNATVRGLAKNHHLFMLTEFNNYEVELNKQLPKKFLIQTNTMGKSVIYGGKYDELIDENKFWNIKK